MLSHDSFNKIKNVALGTVKNFVSLSALNMTGANDMIMNAMPDNMVARNLGRGFIWYILDEGEGWVMGDPESNFVNFNWENLIDDTVFNAVISAGVEQFGVFDMVRQNVNVFSGTNNDVLATALIKNTAHEVLRDFDIMPVKNITKFIKGF